MNGLNETPAVDSAEPVIYEPGSAEAESAEFTPEDFSGNKLPAPADDVAPPWPDKPIVQLRDGDVDALVLRSQEILSPSIYTRGMTLCWIGAATELPADKIKPANKIKRASEQRSIIPVTAAYIVRQMSRLATVQKCDGRLEKQGQPPQWRTTDWTERLARLLLDYQNWPQLRPLDAIVRAPFVREDGTICDEPGYDASSRCFYDPNADYPELPEKVSRDDALSALETLRAPFAEFPYATPAAESAFIANVLTEAARVAIDRSPMYWFTSQYPASGKGLLASMPAIIVHGAAPSLRPWVSTGDELRKSLFASLMAGDRSIAFDNLPSGYKARAPELCAFLTSDSWKDRKLGVSEVLGLPNKAVISVTGNNVSAAGDLARRSLVVRLDANSPDLKSRTFKIMPLSGYVQAHRVELFMAALTIIRGHQQSGHVGPAPLQSFEQWSHMVRDALLWLGMSDPLETQSETDDETTTLDDAFATLAPKMAGRKFTPGDVVKEVQSITEADGKLAAALRDGGCSDPQDVQTVGYFLRESRDKFGAGFKLELVPGSATHSKRYQFKQVTTAASAPVDPNADLTGGVS